MSKVRLSFSTEELKVLVHCTAKEAEYKKLHTKLKVAMIKLDGVEVVSSQEPAESMNERRKQDYELWLETPEHELTEQQVRNAKQYMYDNGLMTEEDAEQYEAEVFGL